MSGVGVQECRAPGRRTSSLHRDVRSLAVSEHLYPAASATYEALSNITYEELTQSTSIETNIRPRQTHRDVLTDGLVTLFKML